MPAASRTYICECLPLPWYALVCLWHSSREVSISRQSSLLRAPCTRARVLRDLRLHLVLSVFGQIFLHSTPSSPCIYEVSRQPQLINCEREHLSSITSISSFRPLSQHVLSHFASARLGQLADDLHLLWHHESADLLILLRPQQNVLAH